MERLVERCAGLDVHEESVWACARVAGARRGGRGEEGARFAAMVGLVALRDWLAGLG